MNLLALSGLVNFLACIGLAYLVWRNRPGDETAKGYAIFNCTVAFFSFFYFVWQLSRTAPEASHWFKLLFLGIVWINQAYLYFVFTFLGTTERPLEKNILRIGVLLNVLFSVLDVCGILFTSVEPRFGFGFWPNPTHWFTVYLVFWHIECLYGFWHLLKAFRRIDLSPRQRLQLKYLVVAFGIGYFGGANNWPMWYGIRFPPYLNNLIAIYIGIIAYAILHRQFMDIRLIFRDTTLHLATAMLLAASCMMIGLPLAAMNPYAAVIGSVSAMGLLMAFAYDPIRKALQPALDRIMFADRFAYLEELGQLPNDMLEFTNLREMLQFLVTRLQEAGRLKSVRVLMFDPGNQSYVESIAQETGEAETAPIGADGGAREVPERSPLALLLKENSRLWTMEELKHIGSEGRAASQVLHEFHGAACFPVMREKELLGIVILGSKQSGEPLNQQDLKILGALRVRLENFLGQAITITQEALNMVKDSHDMKNDINALKGRGTWRTMKIAAWKIEFEKQMVSLESWLIAGESSGIATNEHAHVKEIVLGLKAQAFEWFADAAHSRSIEENAIQRLAHRLKNWAEYGRVVSEGFRGSRQKEAVDVGSIAKLSVERWRPMAERKNLKIAVKISGEPRVWGERSLVEQIIENLIDNAIKATSEGTVDISVSAEGKEVHMEVRDSGCGIPAEDLGTIFTKPFYQGRGRETMEQSTGVGLYLVAQYVKSLGGKVRAESQFGHGSLFAVVLPASEEANRREGAAA